MDKWSELRTVYHVAKLGTVSKAAETLDMHRATVNRHIDAIESDIGGRVFIRHSRGYTLTELGQEVLQVAERTT
ncbi:MAG: LysR family transcriptional regulator, partial [Pseudomonadota bacterium]